MTFVVEPLAPVVTTEGAAAVTRTTAALYGLVDPLGGGVSSCAFEVGATTAYAQSVECGFVEEAMTAFPPAANAAIPVFVRIFGLTPSTTYHFRLVALGEGGTARTGDDTFTTQPPFSFGDHPAAPPATTGPTIPARGLAADKVIAFIARQRTVPGRRDTISSLLRQGRFKMSFTAPEAGTLAVAWYYGKAANGAKRALVASGRFAFADVTKHAVTVRLTAYGRRLLARSTRLHLTATCNFTPIGARTVRVSKSFDLRR